MSHLKRQEAPRIWPVPRKGTAYIVRPLANPDSAIPLLIVLRDLLKISQNRREVKRAIHLNQILLNAKPARDDKAHLSLFDTISILPSKKHYRVELTEKGKFDVKEIKENEADLKLAKIINKKTLRGKKIQLNLSDGQNVLSDTKCKVNDSLLINLKNKKVEKCLSLKEGAKILIFAGKHAGEKGMVKEIDSNNKTVKTMIDGAHVNVLIKQMIVTE